VVHRPSVTHYFSVVHWASAVHWPSAQTLLKPFLTKLNPSPSALQEPSEPSRSSQIPSHASWPAQHRCQLPVSWQLSCWPQSQAPNRATGHAGLFKHSLQPPQCIDHAPYEHTSCSAPPQCIHHHNAYIMLGTTAMHTSCSLRAYLPTTFTAACSTFTKKRSSVSYENLATGKFGDGKASFDIGISLSAISPKSKLADKGKSPHAIYSSMTS
jgi:hypothetical protein